MSKYFWQYKYLAEKSTPLPPPAGDNLRYRVVAYFGVFSFIKFKTQVSRLKIYVMQNLDICVVHLDTILKLVAGFVAGIVERVVQPDAFAHSFCVLNDKVANGNQVAQLAKVLRKRRFLVEFLGFLIYNS